MKTKKIKTSEIDNYFGGFAAMQAMAVLSIQDSYIVTIGDTKYIITNSNN